MVGPERVYLLINKRRVGDRRLLIGTVVDINVEPKRRLHVWYAKERYGLLDVGCALFFDDTAGDAITRVAGRVGHEVVWLGMDDDGGAAFMEERIRTVAECDAT